jgi:hypothetical protein
MEDIDDFNEFNDFIDFNDFNAIFLNFNPWSPYLSLREKGAVIERRRSGMSTEDIIKKVYELNKPGINSQKAYCKAKTRMLRILEQAGMH